ncbi:YdeI family protein [Zhouia sp. PK063]|uniref:YdeI family protein n=1 Tax=Zhouia sp. PK063 TaxID=3373602 RepID=UPI0037B758F1
MKEAEEFCPKNKEEWRRWLELNHLNQDAIWLIFHKKTSPNYNLSWSESVDASLCYGWIDSTKRAIDKDRYKQYFTKRKAKSNWSKINKDKVAILIAKGLMATAGYKSIEIAKENGSWTILDGIENIEIPKDLKQELMRYNEAIAYFENLSKSNKKILLHWVNSAKRTETRQKRIMEIVESSRQQTKPKQLR